jgi:DNA-binding response OmpR family regulator
MMDIGIVSATDCAMVVVVDDEPDIAREIAEGLAADGFQSMAASSAEQVIALLDQDEGRIGVVVTDLRMPGMDGLDLIRRLRDPARGATAPEVVMMSGHASPAEKLAARQAGALAVLSKPFAWSELAQAVDEALGRARIRRGVTPPAAGPA